MRLKQLASPRTPKSPRKRRSLLCIDDHPDLLAIFKEFLEACGYSVVAALSGREGIAALGTHRVDGVIVDYDMPKMNGIEVAKEIKRLYPEVPILMLSGDVSTLPKSAHRVVDRFVSKGTFPEKLLLEITMLLNSVGPFMPVMKKPVAKAGNRKRA